ncbi:hypothetical protein CAPTEDRAFT_98250 [Capitella teleta]|uniref:Ionotropic glutamate receptor C-terminal domain-containing protein n=1 Tax=Capitella teleta TaxID=283909 RepID=R7V4I3_CAPTE|nr:hypothetical protein CAPTEDRAFT_98250 [Capitella teleta]|eukprot:ELU13748.1 hypothetical protein CAPTEDRAFT_98250 [Capitella teleta]
MYPYFLQEADMVAAPVSTTLARSKVMDTTSMHVHIIYRSFAYRKPHASVSFLGYFFMPLAQSVWLYILLAIAIVSGLFWWIGLLNRELMFITKSRSFWLCFSAILQQGSPHSPCSCSGRMLSACWWFFAITLAAVYNGNIMASSAVAKLNIPFTTFEDIAEQSDHLIGLFGGTADLTFYGVRTC